MHKFVRNLLTEWRKLELPFEDETFIAAVSGGADSVSLALALKDLSARKKLKIRFIIAHFNHKLRGAKSEKDVGFVEDLAKKLGFEFVAGNANAKFNISKKGNLEQNARIARYEFLIETAENFNAYGILTAHTINDQAETFLINLIRGSGISGLSAMKAVISDFRFEISNPEEKSKIQNPKSKISLVRPFLSWAKREDTENFCLENKIEFRQDEMNEDLSFRRVQIRKKLLPLLKEFNPKIIETLANTSNLLRIEVSAQSENKIPKINTNEGFLKLSKLTNLSKSEVYTTIRNWLKENRGNLRQLELKHIESIERLISGRKSGRIVELPNGEKVEKKGGKLFFQKRKVEKTVAGN